MRALIFDVESTGFKNPEVIEAAWLSVEWGGLEVKDSFVGRFKPTGSIEYGAMACHHILPNELEDCPPSSTFSLPAEHSFLIGHNVDSDWEVIGKPPIRRICTLALARSVWPDLDSHTQSALMYYLNPSTDLRTTRRLVQTAHSALVDVGICRGILDAIIGKLRNTTHLTSFEDLWAASEDARIPKIMPFGKHKGTPIYLVPLDYKLWLRKQKNVDPYLLKAL